MKVLPCAHAPRRGNIPETALLYTCHVTQPRRPRPGVAQQMRVMCELVTPLLKRSSSGECAVHGGFVVCHSFRARKQAVAVVAHRIFDAVLLHAWRWKAPKAGLSQESRETHNKNKTPVISRYRPFVLLRAFHINNNNNNNNTGCLQGGFEINDGHSHSWCA